MESVHACELGREPVNSVSASVLANVLRDLVTKYHKRRSKLHDVQIRCGDNLEIRRRLRKLGEDEGFESDDDTRSNTSSCCLVEDHVFKILDRSSPSTTSADSANSSGSDTDELDVPNFSKSLETYPLRDVIFCHTEPRYVNTIAWVIKKKKSLFENSSAFSDDLVVIVVKCKSAEDFKKLCDSYRETSRRLKLDHYKSYRRKPIVLTNVTDTKDVKVSLSDMKAGKSSLLKASELSILNPKIISSFKTELKNSVSLNSLTESRDETLKKASSLMNINKFNILHRTDPDGMTHIEISKNKSKIQKEIEGVILTDVDVKREPVRQIEHLWKEEIKPPQRPERKKFRKKNPAPSPPNFPESKSKFYLRIEDETPNSQYVRLQSWPDKWSKDERITRRDERTIDRRRARSVGRPPRKTPMAYRYIDITDAGRKPAVQDDGTRRRRNSFDDMIQHKSTLKPVIKSNMKMHKMGEPKKVTFSAYATVQVVD